MGDHNFKDKPILNGKTVGGDIRGQEHFDKTYNRPEPGPMAKRPMIDASSHIGSDVKQKTVKTTLGESEVVILNHQASGWRIESSLAIGGNEVLLTFGR